MPIDWKTLSQERDKKYNQRKVCFSADFGDSKTAFVFATLLAIYHKNREYICELQSPNGGSQAEQQNATLQKIFKLFLNPGDSSVSIDEQEFEFLLEQNDKVRKYLRLFWEECPKVIQEKIFAYELKKWMSEKRQEGKKYPILLKISQNLTITNSDWNLINSGKTADLVHYFKATRNIESLVGKGEIELRKIDRSLAPQARLVEDSRKFKPATTETSQVSKVYTPGRVDESDESYLNRIAALAAVCRRFIVRAGFFGTEQTCKTEANQYLKDFFKSKEVLSSSCSASVFSSTDDVVERIKSQRIINDLKEGEHRRILGPFKSIIEGTKTHKQHIANAREQDRVDKEIMNLARRDALLMK